MADFTGFAHAALTVTDFERSKTWYSDTLGWQELFGGDDGGIRYGVGTLPGGPILGLRQHPSGSGEPFSETTTGLDHLALGVSSRTELEEWAATFEDKGVTYSPIQDVPYGHVLNFRDPDNIALELFAMPAG
ncbi:MAG: VOC family protein [Actinomycetota bacterium]|nr:VOC family protein [Actinomycetota bacterium]